jgi:hypothetical protein
MEAIAKIPALEHAVTAPSPAVGAQRDSNGGAASPEEVLNRFEAMMGRHPNSALNSADGAVRSDLLEPSALVSSIGDLAGDSLAVAEENDALIQNEDLSTSELTLRMGVLAQEMRLVGLQLKAFSEVSKQTRDGVQTLIKS